MFFWNSFVLLIIQWMLAIDISPSNLDSTLCFVQPGISHASKVMLRIFQSRLQQYVNREIPDVQDGFRKVRGTRDQVANICWITKKQENSRKTSTSASLTMQKPFTVWITTNCGKFFKRWDYQTALPTSYETWIQVRKQQI